MRRLRIAGILLSGLVAICGAGTAMADREQERPRSRPDWVPGFSLSYRCTDARDQLEARDLTYDLRYEDTRWRALTSLTVDTAGLRSGCDVAFAVPRGATDAGGGNVTLERDGSPAAGTAAAHVRPETGRQDYVLDVVLPVNYDVAHSLGIGKHFFRFDFFGAAEAGSFGTGVVEITVPEGYSLTDASPGGIKGPTPSHTWTLRAGRDFEAAVTFRQDTLREVVELAPSIAFGAGALLLALLAIPSRREPEPEEEPAAEPEPEPVTVPIPAPAPVAATPPPTTPTAPIPAPATATPVEAPTAAPAAPETPVTPTPVETPDPTPVPAPAETPAPAPAPVPRPATPAPAARAAARSALSPPPRRAPERKPWARKYVWLGLLAIPIVSRLLRRRR